MPIDFASIKSTVTLEQAAAFLELKLKPHNDTFRCACPQCDKGGDRAIVITPAKRVYYCHIGRKGGDVTDLVSHVKGITQTQAAQLLQDHFMRELEKPKRKRVPTNRRKNSNTASNAPVGGTEFTIVDFLNL